MPTSHAPTAARPCQASTGRSTAASLARTSRTSARWLIAATPPWLTPHRLLPVISGVIPANIAHLRCPALRRSVNASPTPTRPCRDSASPMSRRTRAPNVSCRATWALHPRRPHRSTAPPRARVSKIVPPTMTVRARTGVSRSAISASAPPASRATSMGGVSRRPDEAEGGGLGMDLAQLGSALPQVCAAPLRRVRALNIHAGRFGDRMALDRPDPITPARQPDPIPQVDLRNRRQYSGPRSRSSATRTTASTPRRRRRPSSTASCLHLDVAVAIDEAYSRARRSSRRPLRWPVGCG